MSAIELRVLEGTSPTIVRSFAPGVPEGPFAVGTAGDWILQGPRVAPKHAYLYYNGSALMIAAAQKGAPTSVNGRDVTSEWLPVNIPSDIRLGGARLEAALPGVHNFADEGTFTANDGERAPWEAMRPMDEEVRTVLLDTRDTAAVFSAMSQPSSLPRPAAGSGVVPQPSKSTGSAFPAPPAASWPADPSKPARPSGGITRPPDSESTRFLPIEQMRKSPDASGPPPPPPPPPPAAGSPPQKYTAPPISFGAPIAPIVPLHEPSVVIAAQNTSGGFHMMEPTMPSIARENRLKRMWREASGLHRLAFILTPLALLVLVLVWIVASPGDPPKNRQQKPGASASASSAPKSPGR